MPENANFDRELNNPAMTEPIWVLRSVVVAMHSEQLAEHGGSESLRDASLLDSALAKPHNVSAASPDIFTLAASYDFGIARNHAFIDGNKRTTAAVSMTFLGLNGWEIEAPKKDEYLTFLQLAEGLVTEEAMAIWFREHAVAI